MSPISAAVIRSARPIFQARQRAPFFTQQYTNTFARQSFRLGRRHASGVPTEGVADAAALQQSWFARMWNSPIGLKTVHFWAPVMKWCLVLAGVSDFYRPADKLSLTQNTALTLTGALWTRWSLIIKPKNYLLAAVNFFLGIVGIIQVSRIMVYRRSVEGQTTKEQLETVKDNAVEAAEGAKAKVKNVVTS